MEGTCILRAFGLQMSFGPSVVLRLFCFVSFSCRGLSSNRSSIWMRPDSHTCFLLVSFVSLEMSLFPSMFVPLPFSRCMESTSHVFPFRTMFFTLWPWAGFFTLAYVIIQSSKGRTVIMSREFDQ